ncbi:MAG: hypothetical protein ACQEWV_06645 [Bacillota bacterium]
MKKNHEQIMKERVETILGMIISNKLKYGNDTKATEIRKRLDLTKQAFYYLLNKSERFQELLKDQGIEYETFNNTVYFSIDESKFQKILKKGS